MSEFTQSVMGLVRKLQEATSKSKQALELVNIAKVQLEVAESRLHEAESLRRDINEQLTQLIEKEGEKHG